MLEPSEQPGGLRGLYGRLRGPHGHRQRDGGVETVDLLKQKLVRRVEMAKSTERSKVLDDSSAYQHIEQAIREVRQTDLPHAAVIF